MKIFLLLFIGVFAMAEQINIPYPHPNYDNDLINKEIINGTYMAAISMQIRNSRTGEERYVYVPDSPDIIQKSEEGKEPDGTDVNSISDEPIIYDRNKSLEDAVLPVKVDVGQEKPMIVSTAMCPQDITYLGNIDISTSIYKNVSRYDDGINKFLVIYEKTNDGSSSQNTDGDIYTFYKYVGTDKTKLFDVSVDDYGTPTFIYSIGKRNFFFSTDGNLYEYSDAGFAKRITISIYEVVPFMVMDGNKIYVVGMHGTIHLQNVDNGDIITSNFSSSSSIAGSRSTAYGYNYFVTNLNAYYVEDGEIKQIKGDNSFYSASAKIRFDYLDSYARSSLMHFNEKHNIYKYPFAHIPSYGTNYLEDSKEAFFSVDYNDRIFYTKDYVNYKDTGIIATGHHYSGDIYHYIANFENYVYIINYNKMDVFQINKWGYQIPRSDLGELFAKDGLINRGINIIGD